MALRDVKINKQRDRFFTHLRLKTFMEMFIFAGVLVTFPSSKKKRIEKMCGYYYCIHILYIHMLYKRY